MGTRTNAVSALFIILSLTLAINTALPTSAYALPQYVDPEVPPDSRLLPLDGGLGPADSTDSDSGSYRLKDGVGRALLYHATALPFYWWWMCLFHESGHAAAANAFDARPTAIRPYPHVHDGNFRFAGFYYSRELPPTKRGLVLAAPLLIDTAFFALSDLTLTYFVSPNLSTAPIYLIGGMLFPTVDFLTNVLSLKRQSDVNRLVDITGVHKAVWVVAGTHVAAVGVWRMINHGMRIFFEKKGAVPVAERVSLVPTVSSGYTGASIRTEF
jgi:hypothetical protein